MSKKILLTGGAGFIGLHLSNRLLDEGFTVHIVDNLARAVFDKEMEEVVKNKNIEFSNLDLLSKESIDTLDKDFDYIFHLAAIIGVRHVLDRPYNVLYDNLINNKYIYTNYQTSQFYGLNLLIKLLFDKILSIIFLIILTPILLLIILLIYIED